MSETKIGITNLPAAGSTPSTAPKATAASSAPSSSAGKLVSTSATSHSGSSGLAFKVAFLVLLAATTFFVVCTIMLQSQVKQAKSDTAQALTALDQARADTAKAQANTHSLVEQTTNLVAQLTLAKQQKADAEASAEKSAQELGLVQAQLAQARNMAAAAQQNARRSAEELAGLRAQMAASSKTGTGPVAAAAPKPPAAAASAASSKPLPLDVSFRKSAFTDGNALFIQNTSGASMPVKVTFSDANGRSKEYQLLIDAGAVKELGSLGAWVLSSGDNIVIESNGYASITQKAP